MNNLIKNYGSIILLLIGVTVGSFIGVYLPDLVDILKPVGDIFLNMLFVAVIPLIFFAIASSIANIQDSNKLGKTIGIMTTVFIGTIIISAIATIVGLWIFPVTAQADASAILEPLIENPNETWGDRIVRFLSVDEFSNLLSRKSILAFVIFSLLVGTATRKSGEAGKHFTAFLNAGNKVMETMLILIMKVGPIGLGAYFAYQVKTFGPEMFGFYAKPLGFYYLFGLLFFIVFYTLYSFIARGKLGITSFWKHNILPTFTALSTCSSLATLPTNLIAGRKIGIPKEIANIVIPLGNTLYKNGSSISSILKIYVAFSILGWNFFEPFTLITAVGITVLVSMVAGGIPNGGFIGEMLMISLYGIPNEAVPAILILGALVDPLATVLNATGDTVAAMLVTRFSGEKFSEDQADS